MTTWCMMKVEGYDVGFTKPWRVYDDRFGSTLILRVDGDIPGVEHKHSGGGTMTKEVRLNRKPRPDGQDNIAGELVLELHKLVRDYERRIIQELLDNAAQADPE